MKPLHLIIVVFFLTLTFSCGSYQGYEDCHDYIYVQNNSDKSVYFAYTFKEDFFNVSIQYNEILPHKRGFIRSTADFECWEQYIKQTTGNIFIYIYDAEYVRSTPWDEVKNNYLKKYKLNVDNLIKSNWIVHYP